MSSHDEIDQPISTVSHKRRVHFPSDESQLRIISIAPEPLSDQPLLSLGVILQRYRAACQRLQIRPINCLLDQLSTVDDNRKSFSDRLDCLRIINERLDLKHIDAMEEIFSRCRFQTLDLDSSFSDDLALVQLFDVIEYYETCTHLNLSNNRSIGVQGYQALTRYMRKTRFLHRFDMNSIRFDDTSMLGLGRSLRLSSTLYELHLESCQLNGKMLHKLIQNLRSCVCLRELYLCDNRLQVQDSILINELIRSCGQFLHLLDLRSNYVQDNGISHIASQLSQYDDNHSQQNSIYKISFQSNQITQQGIGFLAKSLLHNRTIRSLNLSHNQIMNEGFYFLRDALLTNRKINELILRNCRLTDQAAIALAEYIAESSSIQYIDLRENNIQASGICGMAIAMKTNRSLLKLDFDTVNSTSTQSNSNHIDRTSGFLSLTNLRRMTVGLGGLSSGTTNNSNGGINENNNNTREFVEQKAKWMNDIECICQRNLLLYEAEQQQIINNDEKSMTNGIDQSQTTAIAPNDVHFEENGTESVPVDHDTQNHHQEIFVLTDEIPDSTDISSTTDNNIEPTLTTSVDTNAPTNEIAQTSIEPVTNGTNHEEIQFRTIDEKSILPDSSSFSEENGDDPKRKIHHSDSLYLLRKKVQNDDDEENNTSDDESQLSSTMESSDPSTFNNP